MKKLLEFIDGDMLVGEYKSFKDTVKSFDPQTPYYVYALAEPSGQIFYIGKGKGLRGWEHIVGAASLRVSGKLKSLNGEPPFVHIMEGNLSESDAYQIERDLIAEYGRFFEGGPLMNVMAGGNEIPDFSEMCSIGGKIGGAQAKKNKSGIFSPNYDISSQSKLNHKLGLIPPPDREISSASGKKTKERLHGIFAPENQQYRSEWASKAAKIQLEKNGIGGCMTKEYREANPELVKKHAAEAGKKGSAKVKNWKFYNNGTINTRAPECPGEGWVRGMILSEKKKANLFGRSNNATKGNYELT